MCFPIVEDEQGPARQGCGRRVEAVVDHLADAPPGIVRAARTGHGRARVVRLLVVLGSLGNFVDDVGEHG